MKNRKTEKLKKISFVIFAVLILAFLSVIWLSFQSWLKTGQTFDEIVDVDFPVIRISSNIALDITQSRTELFRYLNEYEPSPYRVKNNIKNALEKISKIDQLSISKDIKIISRELEKNLNLYLELIKKLEYCFRNDDHLCISQLTSITVEAGTTLSLLYSKLGTSIQAFYRRKSMASKIELMDNTLLLMSVSLFILFSLILGIIFWNRTLHQEVHARTMELNRQLKETDLAHKELKKSEEQFRFLTENSASMIYRQSLPNGKYEYVSPASIEITGYTPREIYSEPMHIRRCIHPDFADYLDEQWGKMLKGDIPPFFEFQIIHKSGEVKWLNQSNVLFYNETGSPVATEGIVTDVTQNKHL
ncbi:MAG: PAS domain-containing protein, partial [Thermodesulfobacteriota bacterium]|nr:PAS domain-containing protein [Thermodesulfobacteriota bacterium]